MSLGGVFCTCKKLCQGSTFYRNHKMMLTLSCGSVSESNFKQENSEILPLDEFKVDENVKYSQVIILSKSALISHEKLSEIMTCLEVHGKISVKYQGNVKATDAETEMKLCGLLSISVKEIEGGSFEIEGIKPDLSLGTAQRRPVKKTSKDALKAFLTSENNVELVDDVNLLREEDLLKPSAVVGEIETCGPQAKKKACKNCSCGLKEIEEAESVKVNEKAPIDTANAKSSCGSVKLLASFVNLY